MIINCVCIQISEVVTLDIQLDDGCSQSEISVCLYTRKLGKAIVIVCRFELLHLLIHVENTAVPSLLS